MFNSGGSNGHFCLVPDLGGAAGGTWSVPSFTIKCRRGCACSIDALYSVEEVSFHSWFAECFYQKEELVVLKCFSSVHEDSDDYVFFLFYVWICFVVCRPFYAISCFLFDVSLKTVMRKMGDIKSIVFLGKEWVWNIFLKSLRASIIEKQSL